MHSAKRARGTDESVPYARVIPPAGRIVHIPPHWHPQVRTWFRDDVGIAPYAYTGNARKFVGTQLRAAEGGGPYECVVPPQGGLSTSRQKSHQTQKISPAGWRG